MKTADRHTKAASSLSLKVWVGIFAYAILAGLAIQLVILPYVFPQLHAGNGLLAGRDWVGFHSQAITEAQRILQGGWAEFRLRPDGDNAIIGITVLFYALLGPHPWAILPLSAAMFATGGLALFSMMKQLDLEDNEALIAILPYLFFPSSLLQYGQIHKDVFCTAGVLVILWTWTSLLRRHRENWQIIPLIVIGALALMVVSVFRPYFMYPFLGLGVVLLFCYLLRTVWQLWRSTGVQDRRAAFIGNLTSVAVILVLNACVYVMSITYLDMRLQPFPVSDAKSKIALPLFSLNSNKDVRSADTVRILSAPVLAGASISPSDPRFAAYVEAAAEAARIKAVEECRPVIILRDDAFIENTINRVFLKIAVARAGFTSSGGTTAASNIDKGIDFCKNEDLIRYIPRALQIAFFAPFPSKWTAVEKRNSSPIEIYVSAAEMLCCYIAYFGLLYWLFTDRRWSVSLLVPIAFALGLCLLLGLTVANVGTLYRMRFPFMMIFVGLGIAGLLRLAKVSRSRRQNALGGKAHLH